MTTAQPTVSLITQDPRRPGLERQGGSERILLHDARRGFPAGRGVGPRRLHMSTFSTVLILSPQDVLSRRVSRKSDSIFAEKPHTDLFFLGPKHTFIKPQDASFSSLSRYFARISSSSQ